MTKHSKKVIENRKKESQANTGKVIALGMVGVGMSRILPKDDALLLLMATMITVGFLCLSEIFNKESNPLARHPKLKHEPSFWKDPEVRDTHSPSVINCSLCTGK